MTKIYQNRRVPWWVYVGIILVALLAICLANMFVTAAVPEPDVVEQISGREYMSPEAYQEPVYEVFQMEATAYVLSDGNGDGDGYTATMTRPMAGRTVSVDPKVIPMGTELTIDGVPGYVAEDVGGAIQGKRIDIYMGSGQAAYDKAIQFGRRTVEVKKLR